MSFFSRRTIAIFMLLLAVTISTLTVLALRIVREQLDSASTRSVPDMPALVDGTLSGLASLDHQLADLLLENGHTAPQDVALTYAHTLEMAIRLDTAGRTYDISPSLLVLADDVVDAIRRGAPLIDKLSEAAFTEAARAHFRTVATKMERLRSEGARFTSEVFRASHAVLTHRLISFVAASIGLAVVVGLLLLLLSRQLTLLDRSNRRATSLNDHLSEVSGDLERASHALEASNAELAEQNRRLRENEQVIEKRNYQFQAALENMLEGLCMVEPDGRLTIVNQRLLAIYRLAPTSVRPGMAISDFLDELGRTGRVAPGTLNAIRQRHTAAAESRRANTFDLHLDDGAVVEVHEQPLVDGGWLVTHEDVTERRQAQLRVQHLATHDSLTGLPNRTQFNELLVAAMADRSEDVAIALIDLDRFKAVNDLYGHAAGDRLLELIADRFRAVARGRCIAARLGGDEFGLLVRGRNVRALVTNIAEEIIRRIREPFDLGAARVEIGLSAGIAVTPDDGLDTTTLQRNADLALYTVKSSRLNTFRFFDAEMGAALASRRSLEIELQRAIARNELVLHFQPIVATETARVVGAEALLRWTSPTRGAVSPEQIVAIAEETGLMASLGDWILGTAIATAASWPDHLSVAVNLSARQFRNPNLIHNVSEALARHDLNPRRLQLEVTETVLCEDDAGAAMSELRSFGIRLSLDDFGTGYASMSYLTRFPFDRIKIDKSFVREAASRTDCRAIIDAVCGLAKTLGLDTVAEGIETADELEIVRAAGCGYGQGYYFGRPLPAPDFLALVSAAPNGRILAAPASDDVQPADSTDRRIRLA
jgi:diguanylate cyclase (GGDEF)-like protein